MRAVRIGFIGDEDIRAKDGFDPFASGGEIELDETEHVAEIRQCQGRHAVVDGAQHRGAFVVFPDIKTYHSVGDGVFTVQTEMDETRIRHCAILPRCLLKAETLPVTARRDWVFFKGRGRGKVLAEASSAAINQDEISAIYNPLAML